MSGNYPAGCSDNDDHFDLPSVGDESEDAEDDEVQSLRMAIRNRYSQIRELNKRLIELGRNPEDE